jgi:hypothetical protein
MGKIKSVVRLPSDVYDLAYRAALREGTGISDIVRMALLATLADGGDFAEEARKRFAAEAASKRFAAEADRKQRVIDRAIAILGDISKEEKEEGQQGRVAKSETTTSAHLPTC